MIHYTSNQNTICDTPPPELRPRRSCTMGALGCKDIGCIGTPCPFATTLVVRVLLQESPNTICDSPPPKLRPLGCIAIDGAVCDLLIILYAGLLPKGMWLGPPISERELARRLIGGAPCTKPPPVAPAF